MVLVHDTSDLGIKRFEAIVSFFNQKKEIENIRDLINQYIQKLSSSSYMKEGLYLRDSAMWCLRQFAEENLIDEKAAKYLLPKIIQSVHVPRANYIRNDAIVLVFYFLTAVDIEIVIERIIKYFQHNLSIEGKKEINAIKLIAELNIKRQIDSEVVKKMLPPIINYLNLEDSRIKDKALFFIASVAKNCIDLSGAKELMPKIIPFLLDGEALENQKHACTFIQLFVDKGGFKYFKCADELLKGFLNILSLEASEIYEQVLKLCNRFLESSFESAFNFKAEQIKRLQEIANRNLKSVNPAIREHAFNLYKLVFSKEEHTKLLNNLILKSVLKSTISNESLSYDSNLLMEFFKDIDQNAVELAPRIMELINEQINLSQSKES